MKNNNTSAVRASVRLAGQALFDLPLSEWPNGIDVVAFPDDAATRALVKAACGKTPVTHPTGPFIPCSVMFGSGSVARKSSGFFRLYAQLVYSRRARIRFGTPTLDPDRAKALYYQGVPPAKDRLSEIRQRTLGESEFADLDRTGPDIKRVNRLIKELAARPNPSFTGFFDEILAWFWNRFYQGLDIQGLTEMRQSLGSKVPIYLVTHRSHLDYLLISWLLYRAGLTPPIIAAGINLNLPVIGRILRAGGAFFIRRQFKGDPLYQKTVRAYVSASLRRRQPILIFPEGGRSRNGQCRPLKLGLMKDVIAAAGHTELAMVPVSLAYDRMPDSQGYRYELEGRAKRSEKVSDLPKAVKLLRAEPLGEVRVKFSAPIPLAIDTHLRQVEDGLMDKWLSDMPAGPVAKIGLLLPGFAGHRAKRSELMKAIGLFDQAADLPETPNIIEQAIALGYLTESKTDTNPVIHAPAEGRDQLLYAAGSVKHRAVALGLLSIGRLTGASQRRIKTLFELAWPAFSAGMHLTSDYQLDLNRADQALHQAKLDKVSDNAQYRLLAALAEPVVADVTRILCVFKVILASTPYPQVAQQARQLAINAMLLSGRSELAVLDARPYEAFIDQLVSMQVYKDGKLTRRLEKSADRWIEAFAGIDRQFVI